MKKKEELSHLRFISNTTLATIGEIGATQLITSCARNCAKAEKIKLPTIMKGINQYQLLKVIIFSLLFFSCSKGKHQENVKGHEYNGSYSGKYLDRIAFPVGGIGAGMFCIEGTGSISHMSVRNRPEVFNEPCRFAGSLPGLLLETRI